MREYDAERDADSVSERTVHDDLEISENHMVSGRNVHTEYEIHVGMADVYYVRQSAADAAERELDLDLETLEYRSGGEIVVVPDAEVDR